MPKILITGNGFDLGFGLPTSYNDFIAIIKHINNSDNWGFISIFEKTQNFNLLTQNFNHFQPNLKEIKKLKEKSLINTWVKYFIKEHAIETWVDFENKIFYVLNIIEKGVDILKKILIGSLTKQNEINNTHILGLINNIEIIEVFKMFNIILTTEIDDDLTKSSFKLNRDFFTIKYNYIVDINYEKILDNIYQSLNEFIEIFYKYFKYFVIPLYDNYKGINFENIFNKIDEHYTFNYTPTFEKIIKLTGKTEFLHGKIDTEKDELKIVLGINQVPANKNRDLFIKFTKTFQKLFLNTEYNFIRKHIPKLLESNVSEYQFIFWGHSLNISDKKYIDEVFQFISKINTSKKEIIVVYHNERSLSELLINLINIRKEDEIENLMRDKILKFYKVDSNELYNSMKRYLYVYHFNPISYI